MKNPLVRAGTILFLCTLAGCASDQRDVLVTNTISQVNDAKARLTTIREEVNKALKKAEKGNITEKDLGIAFEATEALKKTGVELQEIKRRGEFAKGALSKEELEEQRKKFGGQLEMAIVEVNKEQKELNQALAELDRANRNVAEALKKKLTEALGQFEVLARR